jgi:light-regulated signal transduction histidine kinase (bacteriophytochrome)
MNAVKRMQELVSDLLEYAKLGQDKIRLTLIDCDEIISNVVANLSDKIKERSAKVVYNKLPKIYGNSILFISLFQNLINNALKYQPEENTPIIEIGAKDLGDSWLFYVKDNGLGIDEKYLKQIFIPFKRLHTKHEFPGSGIGLAICKRIINKCSGNIWAESELGKGSTFYFTLLKTTANNQDLMS